LLSFAFLAALVGTFDLLFTLTLSISTVARQWFLWGGKIDATSLEKRADEFVKIEEVCLL